MLKCIQRSDQSNASKHKYTRSRCHASSIMLVVRVNSEVKHNNVQLHVTSHLQMQIGKTQLQRGHFSHSPSLVYHKHNNNHLVRTHIHTRTHYKYTNDNNTTYTHNRQLKTAVTLPSMQHCLSVIKCTSQAADTSQSLGLYSILNSFVTIFKQYSAQ
jgi:hypothetical protein